MNTKVVLSAGLFCIAAVNVGQAALSKLDIGYYTGNTFNISAGNGSYVKNGVVASAFSAKLVQGDPLPDSHSNPFITFCLDLDQILNEPNWWKSGSFTDVTLTSDTGLLRQGTASLQYAAELYATYGGGNSSGFSGVIMPANGNWSTASAAQRAEGSALQLAIWEVLYETGPFNVTAGTGFKVTSTANSITARANSMLNSVVYGSPDINLTTTFWNATDSTGTAQRGSQDLIGPITAVPEPSTVVAGALLLLPFLGSTLRVWQKRQS